MVAPQEPAPQPQPQQQVALQPWSWEFPLIGHVDGNPVMMIVITRPLGERVCHPAAVADVKRFHQALGDALRQHDTGLIVPGPGFQVPPNGHR